MDPTISPLIPLSVFLSTDICVFPCFDLQRWYRLLYQIVIRKHPEKYL